MICETLDEFLAAIPASGGLIGLDPGTKTIGVAVSDATRFIATPLETVAKKNFTQDSARLLDIIAARSLGAIVIGLPLNMDGTAGPRVQATRAFARNLARVTALPIGYWMSGCPQRRRAHDDRAGCIASEARCGDRFHGRCVYFARHAGLAVQSNTTILNGVRL